MRSDRSPNRPGRNAWGGTGNRPWERPIADFDAPFLPIRPEPPARLHLPWAVAPSPAEAPSSNPSVVEGGNGGNGEETLGNQGEIAYPQDGNGEGNGEERPIAPPGLAPRARPAPPDNPSRARIEPSERYRASDPAPQAPGSPLPSRSESLPTGLRPIGTPVPWSQGRIPLTYLVPASHRTTRYRTTTCQNGEGVTPVGDGRGCPIKRRFSDEGTHRPG